jgi:hypothetical protein
MSMSSLLVSTRKRKHPNNTPTRKQTRKQKSFFDDLPVEITIIIAENLNPADLYALICTSKYFRDLIMSRQSYFARFYANVMLLDVERFMWNLFDYEHLLIKNQTKLFLRMLGIHKFTQTNKLEIEWSNYSMDDNEDYGPLPTDPTELYIKKFQCGMFHGFNENYSVFLSGMHSYLTTNETFNFLFKIYNKYNHAAGEWCELIEHDVNDFHENGLTFETFDNYFQQALSYGARDFDIYYAIRLNVFDEFLRMLTYGVPSKKAAYDAEDNQNYTDEELQTYNAVRFIIGNDLAYHYILYQRIVMANNPNFLTNVSRLYAIGVESTIVINAFLNNPTDVNFQCIQFQQELLGEVDVSLLETI